LHTATFLECKVRLVFSHFINDCL